MEKKYVKSYSEVINESTEIDEDIITWVKDKIKKHKSKKRDKESDDINKKIDDITSRPIGRYNNIVGNVSAELKDKLIDKSLGTSYKEKIKDFIDKKPSVITAIGFFSDEYSLTLNSVNLEENLIEVKLKSSTYNKIMKVTFRYSVDELKISVEENNTSKYTEKYLKSINDSTKIEEFFVNYFKNKIEKKSK